MVLLRAKNIRKSFGYPKKIEVLSGVDLEVKPGESVAIIGRSGQGKSTLLHILGTLDKPTDGELEIVAQNALNGTLSTIRNRHVAFIFQSFQLLEDYTALENVLMPAKVGRQDVSVGSEAHTKALKLLDEVGLSDRTNFQAKLLSGGEKQRVAIARAFLNDPDIIFADEPSGNLDTESADEIHRHLLEYVRSKARGLVVVTHDHKLAGLCDTQYLLEEGKLQNISLT